MSTPGGYLMVPTRQGFYFSDYPKCFFCCWGSHVYSWWIPNGANEARSILLSLSHIMFNFCWGSSCVYSWWIPKKCQQSQESSSLDHPTLCSISVGVSLVSTPGGYPMKPGVYFSDYPKLCSIFVGVSLMSTPGGYLTVPTKPGVYFSALSKLSSAFCWGIIHAYSWWIPNGANKARSLLLSTLINILQLVVGASLVSTPGGYLPKPGVYLSAQSQIIFNSFVGAWKQ